MPGDRRCVFAAVVFITIMNVRCNAQVDDTPKAPVADPTGTVNPFTSAEDVHQGGLTLDTYCAVCHGRPGRPGRAPDLVRGILRHGVSDKSVFANIKNGVTGTQMVGIPDIDDKIVWQIVACIRSRRKPEPLPDGDKGAGHAVFLKNSCTTCHWNGSEGGRRGPDLTGSYVPVDYIRESLFEPDANLRNDPNFEHERYQQIVVVTNRGVPLAGRWCNDDGRHFLFIDQDERLHSFRKDEMEEVTKPRQSLMPSFRALLTDRDVDNLIVYLLSIRPTPKEEEELK